MAVGDVQSSMASTAADAYLDIRPADGEEWVVHTIYHEAECELYLSNGTNEFLFDSDAAGGAWYGLTLHVRYGQYVRIRQKNAAAKWVGYDGIETKEVVV